MRACVHAPERPVTPPRRSLASSRAVAPVLPVFQTQTLLRRVDSVILAASTSMILTYGELRKRIARLKEIATIPGKLTAFEELYGRFVPTPCHPPGGLPTQLVEQAPTQV